MKDSENKGMNRRQFLQLMSASMALAGLSGCRFPREEIAPFANRPMNATPGEPVAYATSMELNGIGVGLLATSFDGRPIKIDGNPLHPVSLGGSNIFQQASVLDLYDPDRARNVTRKQHGRELTRSWDDFKAYAEHLFNRYSSKDGEGLCILAEYSSSPSVNDMKQRFINAFRSAKWIDYEPVSRDNARKGSKLLYNDFYRTQFDVEKADVILALDSDFLFQDPAALRYAHDFAKDRTADDGKMKRLYSVESNLSITGAMADHRLAIPSGQVGDFAVALLAELVNTGLRLPRELSGLKSDLRNNKKNTFSPAFIKRLVKDLATHKGRSIVICGYRQPPEVQALALVLNQVLDNFFQTVWCTEETDIDRFTDMPGIETLTREMHNGKVDALLILGGNPVYNAPGELKFAKTLQQVKHAMYLGHYKNETAASCEWALPRTHYLEEWGDLRAYDGTVSVCQPLIEPLYDSKSIIETLAFVLDRKPFDGYSITRRTLGLENDEKAWRKLLHDGFQQKRRERQLAPSIMNSEWLTDYLSRRTYAVEPSLKNLEVMFSPSNKIYDGRYANNGWLQELPDPITKLTWDNAALMSPVTARALKLKRYDLVKLVLKNRKIEIPVVEVPGHADNTITLYLGYGRTKAGRQGNGVGTDVYHLMAANGSHFSHGATVTKTGKQYMLATTQEHHSIAPVGRASAEKRIPELAREATLKEYQKHPEFAKHVVHHPPLKSLWKEHEYKDYKWAMAIDLSRCIGCNACVIACQAENNSPIVGKEQIIKSREMHWLRIDRYFRNDGDKLQVTFQPVPCQQCENAPCEEVCPVGATMHTEEGLNDQVYNRCIGMRYCSNNCPYKVRRFNYYAFLKGISKIEQMVFNPDVTVRMRGIMEKCTYCVQRIQNAKILAKRENRLVRDGEITPACAQACPTKAIVFGDLNDPESAVSKLHKHNRAYAMLEELNVKPRTKYLAKIRNPAL